MHKIFARSFHPMFIELWCVYLKVRFGDGVSKVTAISSVFHRLQTKIFILKAIVSFGEEFKNPLNQNRLLKKWPLKKNDAFPIVYQIHLHSRFDVCMLIYNRNLYPTKLIPKSLFAVFHSLLKIFLFPPRSQI